MKICLINRSYLDKNWDGLSTYTHHLSQGLKENDQEVHIITSSQDRRNQKDEKQDNIWIHKVKLFKKLGKFNNLIYSLKVYFKFREINKKYEIDIVEAPEAGAEGFWLSIFTGKKLVTRLHTPLYLCHILNEVNINWSRRLLNFMEKTQTKKSILISSPSKSISQIVSKIWQIEEKKIKIIPSPINLKKLKDYKKIKNKNYLLYLGRIEKRKGVDVLFKALEIVFKKYPNLYIFLVGGVDRTYDKSRLKKIPSRINKNLIFVGEINHSQVFSYIKGAKLVVLPSLWEGFGYTLLESLSLGKVVITSNGGGFKEIIKDNQNGFLFKSGSSKRLAQKIIECLELRKDKIKKIESEARKTSLKYNIKKIVPEMIKFYSQVKYFSKK